jgi:hypothetical protein
LRKSFSYSRQALVKKVGQLVGAAMPIAKLKIRRRAFGYGCLICQGVAIAFALPARKTRPSLNVAQMAELTTEESRPVPVRISEKVQPGLLPIKLMTI